MSKQEAEGVITDVFSLLRSVDVREQVRCCSVLNRELVNSLDFRRRDLKHLQEGFSYRPGNWLLTRMPPMGLGLGG